MGEVLAGRFELLEPIASGGMGTVWLVRDRTGGPLLAAKVLDQRDASSLLRFVREQAVRIDHPHVVTPLSWAGTDETVLFTMPLVRGGSVATLLSDFGALPTTWVATLLDQLLAGLEAVHRAGVVHRDVKPANLLLDATGRGRPHLRLTDFGIAAGRDEPRLTRPWSTVGSVGYMAPEQLRGAPPDPRQDLWAVGVVGLEMLGDPEPGTADGPLVSLLRRASSPEMSERPPSAAAMRAELSGLELAHTPGTDPEEVEVFDHLEPLLSAHDVLEPASSPSAPTAAPRRSRRTGLVLVLVGLLLLLAAALLALSG